jgi:hypothetical protein
LERNIFTTPPTFHGPTIGNHDLKVVDFSNIAISFFGNVAMNKIMGASNVNEDVDLSMLNVTNDLEGLGRKESSESIQGSDWFNLWGV